MKVFGKTNQGYTVHITQEEMDLIVFGRSQAKYSAKEIPNYEEIDKKIKTGLCEVEICGRFKRIMSIAQDSEFKELDAYNSIIKKMKTAIQNLRPYEKLIMELDSTIDPTA